MFFMNNFAIADLTMLLFRSLSVDLRINKSNVVDWKYGEYLCYFENTIEVLVSGEPLVQSLVQPLVQWSLWTGLKQLTQISDRYFSGLCLDDNNDGA